MAGRIYITGATGRLGKAVLRRIDAVPLVRKASGLQDEIITDFSARQLKGILNDAGVIIHIAGSVDVLNEKAMREANVGLTRRIAEAAPRSCRIILAGSISVYGKELARLPASENAPLNPDSPYARSKHEAERIVLAHANNVIFRIGTVYGPGFQDYFKVLSLLEQGRMKMIGNGRNRIPFVHVDDVADAFAAAVGKGNGIYNIVGEPLTQEEVYAIAAKALGVPGPKGSMPRAAARLLASWQGFLYHLGGKRPAFTIEHVNILSCDRAFDCSRAKKELGFSPRDLRNGIMEVVRDYKAAKGA